MNLKTTNIKGKEYVQVNERIRAFREIYPSWSIVTKIESCQDGVVLMSATILDEQGRVMATGHAYEREGSSFINATSYIENCETSAVGRALGILGIGVDTSIATAEEVANAIKQQDNPESLDDTLAAAERTNCIRRICTLRDQLSSDDKEKFRAEYPQGTKGLSIPELEQLENELKDVLVKSATKKLFGKDAA